MSARLVVDAGGGHVAAVIYLLTMHGEGPIGWERGTIEDATEIADDFGIEVSMSDLEGRKVCRVMPGGKVTFET